MFYFVASLVLLLSLAAALVGTRIGRRLRVGASDADRAQLYGMEASLLGLLALLLGFSFAMAESRYDRRRQLVVEEGNAIGTARLRTFTVPEARGGEIRRLLESYVDVRIGAYRARDIAGVRAALAESARLSRDAWTQASALAREDPRSLPVSLLLQALNEVIDDDARRIDAARNHVPGTVLVMLLVVTVIAMGWVGACIGVGQRRGLGTALILSLLISMVVTVIFDLDQPRRGLIRVEQGTLIDLQRSFR